MRPRDIICACEDITRGDLNSAIEDGRHDLESMKRYTGLATGICQGRMCITKAARLLSDAGCEPSHLIPTTSRPPLTPTPLSVLAATGELPALYPSKAAPQIHHAPKKSKPPPVLEPLPKKAAIVIIGGGIMGLATAYHLAKNGERNVVVLEKSYINAGASGRNGGGIREQWSTAQNVNLMKESINICQQFAKELGINVWLRQGGYLFLASAAEQMAAIEKNVKLQNELGVPTKILKTKEIKKLVPDINTQDVIGACFNPEDGIMFPWPFLWGYLKGARDRGVHVATFTPATNIRIEAGKITGVETPRGEITCDLVINATAAWAPEIGKMAGVKLPNKPERHEILVSESLRPFLGPLVSEIGTGLYFSQSMRGEIVGGLGDPNEPSGIEMQSSARFIRRMARSMVHRIPRLGMVKVLRQWAGCYDVTPDGNPIVGAVDQVDGFFQLHGFMGHGFMMAPVVGKIVGEYLAKGRNHDFIFENSLSRFKNDNGRSHETLIIG